MADKPHVEPVIRVRGMTKDFQMGEDIVVRALRGIDLDIYPGELTTIMGGPSGSGKSTLMNMIGCLDSPTSGDYYLDGVLVSELEDDELAEVRNKKNRFCFSEVQPFATHFCHRERGTSFAVQR